jgi:hypothetical protein
MITDPNIIANGLHHMARLTGQTTGGSLSNLGNLNGLKNINWGNLAGLNLGQLGLHGTSSSATPPAVSCTTGYDCLPAWRWAGFSHNPGFNVNLGLGDLVDQIIDPIGQVMFWLANFWWSILMALVQVITSFDVIGTTKFANSINKTFSDIGNQLNSTGLIFAVAVVGLFGAMWKAIRGNHQHGIRAAIKVLLPLGLLIGMTEMAAQHTNDATKTPSGGTEITAAAGTPAWLVQKLQTEVDLAGGWLATAITPNNSSLVPNQSDTRSPACTTYLQTLNQAGESTLQSSSNSAVSASAFLPVTVSYLWEQSYLPVWTSAQFGNSGLGDRVACHYLDMKEAVDPSQQAAIGVASKYPPNVNYAPTSNGPGGVYGPLSNASQYTQDIYAWSMCVYKNNKWTSAADYVNLDVGQGSSGPVLWSSVAPQACQQWWTQGAGIYNQHWDGSSSAGLPNCGGVFGGTCNPFALTTGGKISGAVYGDPTAATGSSTATARSKDAFDFMTDFEGHNAGGMLLGGIVVNVVSLALVWAMAGLCLGVVVAGFALFLLAMLLPLLLLGMALASEHQHMAKRGFKMGLSMMAAKGIMITLLGLLVLFINAVQSIWIVPPGEGSIGTAFLQALPPVAGLAVLAMLAKRMLGISLMNPLSASRLGWSMAKEADRGWGGAAGALGSRLSNHRNPLVRSAFGGGMAAGAGGALGAFEMDRLLRRHQKKEVLTRGAGTEQNPGALTTARRTGQRLGKKDKGLGAGGAGGPTVPGGRLAGWLGRPPNQGGAAGAVEAGAQSRGGAGAGELDPRASRNITALAADGQVTWGTRAAAIKQGLSKDALKGKMKGLPQTLTNRYKQMEAQHGKWGAAAGVAGGALALGAGLAFAPSLALAAGYAGMRASHRLSDRSVQVGRHVNSLYSRTTGSLDQRLGLAVPAATGEALLSGRVIDSPDHSAADAAAYVEAMRRSLPDPGATSDDWMDAHGPAYMDAWRELNYDPIVARQEAEAAVNALREATAPPPPRIDRQPIFIDSGGSGASPMGRDRGLAAMAAAPAPARPLRQPAATQASRHYIEQQRGTYDDQGRWVTTVPNSSPGSSGGKRQTPQQRRGSNRNANTQRRPRPPRGSVGSQQPRQTDPQKAIPPPPDRSNPGGTP